MDGCEREKISAFRSTSRKNLFCFGGIYAGWTDKTMGEHLQTFSIITTEANALMEKIHNLKKRMPVIISPDRYDEWLDANLSSDQITDFFTPFPTERMKAESILFPGA